MRSSWLTFQASSSLLEAISVILGLKASPCTAIAMFGDFADDVLICRPLHARGICAGAVIAIHTLGRIDGQLPAAWLKTIRHMMVATLACRVIFVRVNPVFQNMVNKIFFPFRCPFPERKPVSMSMRILKHSSCRANCVHFSEIIVSYLP